MKPFHIRLPATSANLGPGFDAVALALDLHLDIRADEAKVYSISASGRDVEISSNLQRNLMLAVYEDVLKSAGLRPIPLSLQIDNEIPIGKGLGSSASARLAGIALANHFGELGWDDNRILLKACELEGHPDNAAACWLGGFTVAGGTGEGMRAISIDPPSSWGAVLALPEQALSTSAARGILPSVYSRADAVTNIQNVALLTAAFNLNRPDLLGLAMADRLHQPYRLEVCPLLPVLLPLTGTDDILGVALSGAGPSVLILVETGHFEMILQKLGQRLLSHQGTELIPCRLKPKVERAS